MDLTHESFPLTPFCRHSTHRQLATPPCEAGTVTDNSSPAGASAPTEEAPLSLPVLLPTPHITASPRTITAPSPYHHCRLSKCEADPSVTFEPFLDESGQALELGKLVYAEGHRKHRKEYVGAVDEEFHCVPHGKGKMVWERGTEYDGEWVYDGPHGEGVYKWPSGNNNTTGATTVSKPIDARCACTFFAFNDHLTII